MVAALGNKPLLTFLADRGAGAAWVTSVCNGALLLAAAGLLDGYAAITHWAWLDSLRKFKKVTVPTCVYARYHRDRNRVTAGGVSSGIDAALFLAGLWFGEGAAKGSQLMNQYAPDPPYADGLPPVADPPVLARAQKQVSGLVAATNAAIDKLGADRPHSPAGRDYGRLAPPTRIGEPSGTGWGPSLRRGAAAPAVRSARARPVRCPPSRGRPGGRSPRPRCTGGVPPPGKDRRARR